MRNARMMAGIVMALAALPAGVSRVAAQERPAEDVTVANDAGFTQKVFVLDGKGELHLLGRVAPGESASFDVPAEIEALGRYRIAFQDVLPPPQLGVPTSEPKIRMAAMPLLPEQGKVVILVGVGAIATVEAY